MNVRFLGVFNLAGFVLLGDLCDFYESINQSI